LQNRNWTGHIIQLWGLPWNPVFSLCDQATKTTYHIAFGCPFPNEVWVPLSGSNPTPLTICVQARNNRCWWNKLFFSSKENENETVTWAYGTCGKSPQRSVWGKGSFRCQYWEHHQETSVVI
jgi:hypothetical protein